MADHAVKIAENLTRARELVERFGASLPTQVDVAAVGVWEKTPFFVLCVRECLIWRIEELGRNALEALERGDEAAGIVLARCVTETTAMMWRLWRLVESRAERDLDALREDVRRLWLGSKNDPAMPQAFNILTMIDHLDREIPHVRHNYDMLSEVAHPNWTGVAGLYCRTDYEQHIAYFGRSGRGNHNAAAASGLLVGGLGLFEYAYNNIAEVVQGWLTELPSLWDDDREDDDTRGAR